MRRVFGLVLLAAFGAGVVYGFVVTRREASYRHVIEQGDSALARDDSYAAIEAFSVAISLKWDSMAAHLKRGEAYRRRGEFEAALRDLRRAAELDVLAVYPRELLGDVHYAAAAADANGAAAHSTFRLAVERYRQAVSLDDESARLQYKLGLASYRAGTVPEAMTALRHAIRLDPRLGEAHYLLGVCLRESQQWQEAVRALERAVVLSPALLQAREELADLYAGLRRYHARLPHLEALAALQPAASRERSLGLGYARAGQLDRAIGQLAEAARRYPTDTETYVELGRLWLERSTDGGVELAKALEALQSGVGNDSSSEAMTLLGRALLRSGDRPRAEQMLRRATTRFPVDPEAFLYLSDVARRRGQVTASHRAILDYAALVPPQSFDADLLARVGEAHLDLGHVAAARRAVDASLDKDPANALALWLSKRLD